MAGKPQAEKAVERFPELGCFAVAVRRIVYEKGMTLDNAIKKSGISKSAWFAGMAGSGGKPTRLPSPPRKRSPTRRPRKLPTARRAIQVHPTAPRRIMGRPQAAPIILETRAIHPPRKTRENPIASRVAATAATPAQTPIQAVHRKRMTPRRISTTGLPRQKPSITTLSTRPSTTTR